MAIPKDKHQISVVVDKAVYEDLNRMSQELGVSVSKIAGALVYAGLDNAKIMHKLGLLKAALYFKGFSEKVNEKLFWAGKAEKPTTIFNAEDAEDT